MLCLHDIDNYMGPPCSNAAVLPFRKTAKQARLVLPQHLPQHLPLNVMRISALTRSLQLIQSTSSLLSRMQLFQRSPSAVVNHLRLGYHIQTPCLPAALSLHRRHGSTGLQGCLPACRAVYQPARVSTNLHQCPPTCKGVHQPAWVSTSLPNRMGIWPYMVSLTAAVLTGLKLRQSRHAACI